MRTLLLLPVLLLLVVNAGQEGAAPTPTADGSQLAVLGFKWTKSRQPNVKQPGASTVPAAAMTTANKNFERNKRVNDPAGVRDPNADTLDARSAAMERNVEESRTPAPESVEVFAYRARVKNAGAKAVEVLFWEYQFAESANPSNMARRQFLCGVQIKPGKEKELLAFSPSGPSAVVSAENLGHKDGDPYQERVVINRIEYSDGTIWQRKDWSFAEVKSAITRVTSTPWGAEMCRLL
jgi:hypothetical protein